MPGSVRVQVEPQEVEVAPGSATRLQVRVVNGTAVVDQFTIVVVGVDQRWAPGAQRVSLLPNQEGIAEIVLAVPREQPPPAGPRVIGVKVSSVADPTVAHVAEVQLTVGAAPAASLSVEPQRVRGGASGRFTIGVGNQGNVPLRVELRGGDTDGAVRFQFTPPVLEVPPGGQAQARLRVSAARPLTGPEVQRALTVRAVGGPVPLTGAATFVQRSRVASGLLRGMVAMGGVTVAGGAVLGAVLLMGAKANQGAKVTTTAAATSLTSKPVPTTVTTVAPTTPPTSSPPTTEPPTSATEQPTTTPSATATTSPLAASGSITFDKFPDGSPVGGSRILNGDEFQAAGIQVSAAPESAYCGEATTAVLAPGTFSASFFALSTARPTDVHACNTVLVGITFTEPVRKVTLVFAGAAVPYRLRVFDTSLSLLGSAEKTAVYNGSTFQIGYTSGSSNIRYVTFGYTTAVTLVKQVSYQR